MHAERTNMLSDCEERISSPVLAAGLDYWRGLIRPGDDLPVYERFDPLHIPRLLASIILLEVRHEPLDFRYRVIGQDVRNNLFDNYTGQWISQIPHQAAPGLLIDSLRSCVAERRPLLPEIPYVGPKRRFREMSVILLPLADADGRVSRLLVFFDFVLLPGKLRPVL